MKSMAIKKEGKLIQSPPKSDLDRTVARMKDAEEQQLGLALRSKVDQALINMLRARMFTDPEAVKEIKKLIKQGSDAAKKLLEELDQAKKRNAQMAEKFLEHQRLPLNSIRSAGDRSRSLQFNKLKSGVR